MALLDEQIDGKYEILRKIREGGMGAIYKVRHRLLDEIRVVKVIRTQAEPSTEASDRFLSEAKAAIRLRHPNIAVLHDFAVAEDGQAFIVMEYIDGWNLQEVMAGYGTPPIGLTLEIARQSLRALGYLHRHKIVHRDVSPDNLMVTRDVEGHLLVKLIDLGIAKNLEGAGGLTTTGVFLGKPRYGSPERFTGEGCDERSDLYSFGVVLYELLTGRPPITGNDSASQMAGHLFRPPVPFEESDRGGRVSPELREIVLWALAKKPEDRFASAEIFLSTLAEVQAACPLAQGDLDAVWAVLQPIDPAPGQRANPAGSTQYRLDQEFGVLQAPTRAVLGPAPVRTQPPVAEAEEVAKTQILPGSEPRTGPQGESTRRTVAPAPNDDPLSQAVVVPFPLPSATVVHEDLDATWARRPLRKEPEPKPKGAVATGAPKAPAASPPVKAGVAEEGGRGVKVLGAVALAGILGVGGWFGWRAWKGAGGSAFGSPGTVEVASPSPGLPESGEPEPTPAPASSSVSGSPAKGQKPGAALSGPSTKPPPTAGRDIPARSKPGLTGTSARPRRVRADQELVGPVQVAPMQLGETILPSQPGVEGPETRSIPFVVYPQAAKGTGKRASVRVSVFVNENGRVIDSKVTGPDNSGLGFNEAAVRAALQTTFLPARRDGIAGKMWTELYFEFSDPQ